MRKGYLFIVLFFLVGVFLGSWSLSLMYYEEKIVSHITNEMEETQSAVRSVIEERYFEDYLSQFDLISGELTDVRLWKEGIIDTRDLPRLIYDCTSVCLTYSGDYSEPMYGVFIYDSVGFIVHDVLFSDVKDEATQTLHEMYDYEFGELTIDTAYSEFEDMLLFYYDGVTDLETSTPIESDSIFPATGEDLGDYRDFTALIAQRDIAQQRDKFELVAVDTSFFGRENEPYQRFVKSLERKLEKRLQVDHTLYVHSLLLINDAELARSAAALATEKALLNCEGNEDCILKVMACGDAECVAEDFIYVDAPQLCAFLHPFNAVAQCQAQFVEFYSPYCVAFGSC